MIVAIIFAALLIGLVWLCTGLDVGPIHPMEPENVE